MNCKDLKQVSQKEKKLSSSLLKVRQQPEIKNIFDILKQVTVTITVDISYITG